jgi:hypothetical protein
MPPQAYGAVAGRYFLVQATTGETSSSGEEKHSLRSGLLTYNASMKRFSSNFTRPDVVELLKLSRPQAESHTLSYIPHILFTLQIHYPSIGVDVEAAIGCVRPHLLQHHNVEESRLLL